MAKTHTSGEHNSHVASHSCGTFGSQLSVVAALWSLAVIASNAPGAPPYDNCSNALVVNVGETAFTNEDATLDGPGIGCAGNIGSDVWFRFTPSFNGPVTISTCDDADFDTIITVYSGCLCDSFNVLACNDQHPSCPNNTSLVTINVQAYQCYRIRLLGFGGAQGTGVLSIDCLQSGNAGCANFTAEGAEAGDRFGDAMSSGGRMNNDSRADFVVGSPFNDHLGKNRGRAYALRGSALTPLYNYNGTENGERMGTAVCSACDLTADGRVDVVVASPRNDKKGKDAGRVWAYSGIDRAKLWSRKGFKPGDQFGFSVACAGDVNDDGYDDIIIGAPFFDRSNKPDAGRAYVINGNTGSKLWVVNGQSAGENFGHSVAGIGDVDGDDIPDFAVGAPAANSEKGKVSIFSGADRSVIQRINGDAAGDRFGEAMTGGNFMLNNVKWSYLIVGAPRSDGAGTDSGRIRIYTRNHSAPVCGSKLCATTFINGESAGDRFGTSVASGQLFDSNQPEILVGAPYSNANGTSSGQAYLFDGAGLSLAQRFFGEAVNDRFGSVVAIVGDVDGDTDIDLAMSAPFNDFAGNNAGRVYVFKNNLVPATAATFSEPMGSRRRRFADIDQSGSVDATDIVAVISAFGPCPAAELSIDSCAGDVDHDGKVDVSDLLRVLGELH